MSGEQKSKMTKQKIELTSVIDWKKGIHHDIGQDVESLRKQGESDRETYERNSLIIQDLATTPVTDYKELAQRMQKYPEYDMDKIILDTDFSKVINNMSIFYFTKDYPQLAQRVIDHVFSSEENFRSVNGCIFSLIRFTKAYPEHEERAIEYVLSHENYFSRVVRGSLLKKFIDAYPDYAERGTALFEKLKEEKLSVTNSGSSGFFPMPPSDQALEKEKSNTASCLVM